MQEEGEAPVSSTNSDCRVSDASDTDTSSDNDTSSDTDTNVSNSTAYYEHESFDTLQLKVHALASELGVIFKDVHRYAGSSSNRMIALTISYPSDETGSPPDALALLRIDRYHDQSSMADDQSAGDQGSDDDPASESNQDSEESPTSEINQGSTDDQVEASALEPVQSPTWSSNASTAVDPVSEPPSFNDNNWNNEESHDWTAWDIHGEAAVLSYLTKAGLPAPSVLAFDTTAENALGMPFSIHTRLPGQRLARVWKDMNVDDKLGIAGQLTNLLAKMQNIKFPGFGPLTCDGSQLVPEKLPPTTSGAIDWADKLKVVGFLKDGERSPNRFRSFNNLHSLMTAQLYHYFHTQGVNFWGCLDEMAIRALLGIKDMYEDMQNMGWITEADRTDTEGVFDCKSFNKGNIMVDRVKDGSWKVTGLLTWASPEAVPPIVAMIPYLWLWDPSASGGHFSDEISAYWDGDYDCMPPEYNYHQGFSPKVTDDGKRIKAKYEEILIEKLYRSKHGDKAEEVYQDDAYGRGRWIRRVWRYALEDLYDATYVQRAYYMFQEWEDYKRSIGFDSDTSSWQKGARIRVKRAPLNPLAVQGQDVLQLEDDGDTLESGEEDISTSEEE